MLFFAQLIFTQVELFAALFLLASLVCTLITVSFLKFRLRRFYGIFLVCVYVVFLVVAILAEAKVFQIHIDGVITVERH
jgi:sodium/potassium/calcium exchanger 6